MQDETIKNQIQEIDEKYFKAHPEETEYIRQYLKGEGNLNWENLCLYTRVVVFNDLPGSQLVFFRQYLNSNFESAYPQNIMEFIDAGGTLTINGNNPESFYEFNVTTEIQKNFTDRQKKKELPPKDEAFNQEYTYLVVLEELRIKSEQLGVTFNNIPEQNSIRYLKTLSTSIYIFEQNFLELKNAIESINTQNPFTIVSTVSFGESHDYTRKKVARYLSNFIISAQSLEYHADTMAKKLYRNNDFINEYNSEKSKTFDPAEIKIVEFIRHYMVHGNVPISLIHVNKLHNLGFSFELIIRLEIQEISDFNKNDRKKWKDFITTYPEFLQKDYIDVFQLTQNYYEALLKFYTWFQARQVVIHSKDLENFKSKEMEFILADLEYRIELIHNSDITDLPLNESQVFINFLEVEHFQEIKQIGYKGLNRVNRIIEILEQRTQLPHKLKTRIYDLYRRFDNIWGDSDD